MSSPDWRERAAEGTGSRPAARQGALPLLPGRSLRGRVDAAAALALAALSLAWLRAGLAPFPLTGARPPDHLAFLLASAQALPLAWCRRNPAGALALSGTAAFLYHLRGYPPTPALLAIPAALYTLSLTAHSWVVALAFLGLTSGLLYFAKRDGLPLEGFMLVEASLIGACLAGHELQERRARAALVAESTARALREERIRIARELHDVVAHSIGAIAVQAKAAEKVLATQPERARRAVATIQATSRQALDELRRVLGVLRAEEEPEAGRAPQPGLAQLSSLADQVRQAGLEVELSVEGTPGALPAGVELCAYRIVQEALTNSLRHAGPTRARVAVRVIGESLDVEVTDEGARPAQPARGGHGGGHGLRGMHERVSLLGGELTTGFRPGGGYRVHARLPLRPPR